MENIPIVNNQESGSTKGLEYVPPPLVESWFLDALDKIVPDAPGAPVGTKLLRLSWGMDRLEYCGGFWERRYGDVQNEPVKYIGRDCWVIEGYQPPSIYDPIEWERQKHLLGPFPENGVYDFITFHCTNTGDYLPLDQSALNHVQIWAHWQGEGKKRSTEELLEAKLALRLQRHKERKEKTDKIALEFGEKVTRLFETWAEPVSVSGKNIEGKNYKKTKGGILMPA